MFGYYYFDVGNIQVAHGRAPAVATAVKRSLPESIVIAYQGDGDLAAIGTAEIVHAANRGEPITVIFVNNGIYGMTGGQMAPTTPLGGKTTTSPFGRNQWTEGFPLHVCELLASMEAPVYIERVALGNNKQIMQAGQRAATGGGEPGEGPGILAGGSAFAVPHHLEDAAGGGAALRARRNGQMFRVGNLRDRTKDAPARPAPAPPPPLDDIPRILGLANGDGAAAAEATRRPRPAGTSMCASGWRVSAARAF